MEQYRISFHSAPRFSEETIRAAMEMPLAAYTPYWRVNTHSELGGSTALLYLLLVEKYQPGTVVDGLGSVYERALASLRSLLEPGHEPAMKVGPIWGHPPTASALVLAHEMPSVWNALTEAEHEKIDWIMRAFCVTCSWATADQNDYYTGPCLEGNYRKGWNPNHRSPGVIPIILATVYFGGADKINEMLVNFSYETYMATFSRLGLTNILRTWARAGRRLFEEGGKCYLPADEPIPAGEGQGVRFPYVYRGIPLSDASGLFSEILLQNTQGGVVTNEMGDPKGQYAYLKGGSSPVLGLDGMMSEFRTHDALGLRSDVIYCASNFCILIPSLVTAITLGVWSPNDPKNAEASEKTEISVIDFLYKITTGYHSYSKGAEHDHDEKSAHGGYPFAKDLWNAFFA